MEDVLKRFREGQRNFTVTLSRGSAVVIEDEIYISVVGQVHCCCVTDTPVALAQ